MADSAANLRDALEEHHEWYRRAELEPTLAKQERDEARRIHAEVGDLIAAARALDGCQSEGWSRETVVISELIGRVEAAIDDHVAHMADVETVLELRVEEGVYAVKVADLLDELDSHIEAAKTEAEQRPSMRCARSPRPSRRSNGLPLI